jgi:hypothetical protein
MMSPRPIIRTVQEAGSGTRNATGKLLPTNPFVSGTRTMSARMSCGSPKIVPKRSALTSQGGGSRGHG